MHNLKPSPIYWGYYIVYCRLVDGRVMYFRGKRRTKLFITDFEVSKNGDWTWEEAYSRLFQHKPEITKKSFAKTLRIKPHETHVSFSGFAGIVLASHLLLPERKR